MKSKKSFLWLYAIISFVLIVSAVIVSLTAGISLATDIGGGTQIEVKISSDTKINSAVEDIKSLLSSNGCSAERIFAEDKYTDTYVVAKIAKKDIKNQDELVAKIATKLGVETEDVSVLEFAGGVTNKAVIWTSVCIVCVLIALFVFGWVRYGVVSGVTLVVAPLHALLVALSLLTLTRLPISMITIIEMLFAVVFVVFATILLLEKIRENKKMKHNQSLSQEEIVNLSNKETIRPLAFGSALILVLAIVLVCIPVRVVTFSALSLVVCLAVAIYSYYCLTITLQSVMLSIEQATQKARLSRNVSPTSAKESEKQAK